MTEQPPARLIDWQATVMRYLQGGNALLDRTLRTLEAETLRDARHASPVFLLDDPFAELDPGRAARVLALLTEVGLGQTVLAVPRDDDVPPELTSLRTFRVAAGTIQPRGSA